MQFFFFIFGNGQFMLACRRGKRVLIFQVEEIWILFSFCIGQLWYGEVFYFVGFRFVFLRIKGIGGFEYFLYLVCLRKGKVFVFWVLVFYSRRFGLRRDLSFVFLFYRRFFVRFFRLFLFYFYNFDRFEFVFSSYYFLVFFF